MNIGISTVLYTPFIHRHINPDLFHALEKIAGYGYTHIEYNDQSVPHPFSLDNGEAVRILKVIKELNLHIHSIHVPCTQLPDADIGSINSGKRRSALEVVRRTLDVCSALDCPNAILHPGGALEKLIEQETLYRVKDAYLSSLQELCEYVKNRKTKIILENGGNPLNSIAALIETISCVNSDSLGICIDTGHAYGTGNDPALLIEQAGKLLEHLHIHDNNGTNDDHLVPGDGTINWPVVMRSLAKISYQGIFMLECAAARSTIEPDKIAKDAINVSKKLILDYYWGKK